MSRSILFTLVFILMSFDTGAVHAQDADAWEMTLFVSGGLMLNIGDEETGVGPHYELGVRLQRGALVLQFDCGQNMMRVGTDNTGIQSWRTTCGPKVGAFTHLGRWDLAVMVGVDGVLGHHLIEYRATSEIFATFGAIANVQVMGTFHDGIFRAGPVVRFRFAEHHRELLFLVAVGVTFDL